MGTVYKARHRHLKKCFALKLINEDRISNEQLQKRFMLEWQAIGAISHRNVVQATDAGRDGGRLYLVMELLEGADLGHIVRKMGPLPVGVACEAIRQTAVGLQAIEHVGLVHRDLKPSNLFVTREKQLKILDLGLARVCCEGDSSLTSSHHAMGTGDFIAPEQGLNAHAVDIRADIYSLGCTLYFLLAGRAPFSDCGSFTQKVMAHNGLPVPPIETFRPELPPSLLVILDHMLAKRPDMRFQTPAHLAEQVGLFASQTEWHKLCDEIVVGAAHSPVQVDRELCQSISSNAFEQRSTPLMPDSRRTDPLVSKRWLLAAGASAVVFGAILGMLALRPAQTLETSDPLLVNGDVHPQGPKAWREFPLMETEPVKLRWPAKSRWEWLEREGLLKVMTTGTALVQLTNMKHSTFRVSVRISQKDWQCDQGIYWGYHDSVQGPCFQFLALRSSGKGSLALCRGWRWQHETANGAAISVPTAEWETLEMTVRDNALVNVRWGAKTLAALGDFDPDMEKRLQRMAKVFRHQGSLGLYAFNGEGVFFNPRLFLLKGTVP